MQNTLTVKREWHSPYNQTTILTDENNKVKLIISSSIRQPKKGLKEITIKNKIYLLNWKNI